MLKQDDLITYTAEAYSNSETVGHVDGYAVFVPNMLTGETATVKITYVKRNVAYGRVVKLLKESELSVTPRCERFGKCGGCVLSRMNYAEQLRFKRGKVEQNLLKIGKLDCEVLPCVPSPKQLEYRNKISLPICGKKGKAYAGMYRKGTHVAVATDDCALSGEWSRALVKEVCDYLNSEGVEPYDEVSFKGEIRHLVARYIDGQLLVVIVSNGEFRRNLKPLIARLGKVFDKFGLFVNVNDNQNNVILGKTTRHIYGIKYIEGEHLGVKFRLQPDSFFQVNNEVKDMIYRKVANLLDLSRAQVLIDCFSGVGVLTNALARDGLETYAIEIEPSAVADAKEMARLNGKQIVNICGDVNAELPPLAEELKGKRSAIVVDPPRKGLGERICRTIVSTQADSVVYISCDSATLARDLALLSQTYDVVYVEPYDMFPQTDQVETVALLARRT